MKRIRLVNPNKDEFMENINNIDSVCWWEQIIWLVESDIDIEFYRKDPDREVRITKENMRVAIEANWEMRG